MKKTDFYLIGNWKMNGSEDKVQKFCQNLQIPANIQIGICPPAPYLKLAHTLLPKSIWIGAQQVSSQTKDGAFTGEISAKMLADVGCHLVIVGHSERRLLFSENDSLCASKCQAVAKQGLRPLLCVGETLEQRDNATRTVTQQLDAVLNSASAEIWEHLMIAYEPVWAIGSGKTPTMEENIKLIKVIRNYLIRQSGAFGATIPVLYGGSVNADNASFLKQGVDGFLVGGASLCYSQFQSIIANIA